MGSDMANLKNSNLKVPPLKIVLSSATSGGSDRSSSTSPSSESESLDSNLTIISDNQHDKSNTSRSESRDETIHGRQERASRNGANRSTCDKASSSATASSSKRSHDNCGPEPNNSESSVCREPTSSSTQRITRSSQRAAQQIKSENSNETNGDETVAMETQDKTVEPSRKVKRRKGEPQDNEQDTNQQVLPPPLVMANICPSDYELPSQNSFELYRDIRKRPYKKLLKLAYIQPKVPHGFKDYLLNCGPYLLDGNRIGVGIKGGSNVHCIKPQNAKTSRLTNLIPPKLKYTNMHQKVSTALNHQPRIDYEIPKPLEAPKYLKYGSPLYELFQDQERSRHRMRMQHLKERERSILSAEQEILRAYNKAAIIDSKQDLNLSACTYFHLQERYHYIDDKNDSIDCVNPKDLLPNDATLEGTQIENEESRRLTSNETKAQSCEDLKSSSDQPNIAVEITEPNEKEKIINDSETKANDAQDTKASQSRRKRSSLNGDDLLSNPNEGPSDAHDVNAKICDNETITTSKGDKIKQENSVSETQVDGYGSETTNGEPFVSPGQKSVRKQQTDSISEKDQSIFNKSAFLKNLQEIDEKWAKVKKEMLIRHRNEADSLFAVQSLDWEWKAKETGACDVRVALKIEPELVPRVEVSAIDY